MKKQNHSNVTMYADFEERVSALLKDGYVIMVNVTMNQGRFVRMKHMANGNRIMLSLIDGVLTQKTNNVIVHRVDYGCC